MNIFSGKLACINFFHLILPCANIYMKVHVNISRDCCSIHKIVDHSLNVFRL